MNGKKVKKIRKAVRLNQDLIETTRSNLRQKDNGQFVWQLNTKRGMFKRLKKIL